MTERLLLAGVVCIGIVCCSGCARHSFTRYKTMFEIPLQVDARPVPGSDAAVRLLSIDFADQRACLEFTKPLLQDRIQECVTNRSTFECKGWFGTQGLRLAEVRPQSVLLERRGARAR